MNLRLYGPRGSCVGGGEKYMDSLAQALSSRHQITQVDNPDEANVVMSNDRPHGKKLCYILQIPYGPIHPLRKLLKSGQREARHDLNRLRMLSDARNSDLVIVYSEFVKDALKQHGIEATVLYTPVQDYASKVKKEKVILSVGRFFEKRIYNHKRYEALIDAFKLFSNQMPEWRYRIVGGMEQSEAEYVYELRKQAAGFPIFFYPNTLPELMGAHYREATLFWHGAGYEARGPEDCESFGISIVEAMSAGCVPIVHFSGGPKEIIWGSEGGALWRTPEDLAQYSLRHGDGQYHFPYFSSNARRRFLDFTVAKFNERALSIFERFE